MTIKDLFLQKKQIIELDNHFSQVIDPKKCIDIDKKINDLENQNYEEDENLAGDYYEDKLRKYIMKNYKDYDSS